MDTLPQVKHCVLMKFDPATDPAIKAGIFQRLQDLRQDLSFQILEMVSGSSSPSPSGPQGLDRGYTDGLVVTFPGLAQRDIYSNDPRHQAIVHDIVLHLVGGIDGLLRFDFMTS